VGADEIIRFTDPVLKERVLCLLKKLGFTYICLDLEGYRQGSMNEPHLITR